MPAAVADIVAEAARLMRIKTSDILGKSRYSAIMRPRHAAMLVARRAGHSFPWIGREMKRDHTTVWAAVSAAEALCERDEDFRALVDALTDFAEGRKALPLPAKRRRGPQIAPTKSKKVALNDWGQEIELARLSKERAAAMELVG